MTENELPLWARDATEALARGEADSQQTVMGSGLAQTPSKEAVLKEAQRVLRTAERDNRTRPPKSISEESETTKRKGGLFGRLIFGTGRSSNSKYLKGI